MGKNLNNWTKKKIKIGDVQHKGFNLVRMLVQQKDDTFWGINKSNPKKRYITSEFVKKLKTKKNIFAKILNSIGPIFFRSFYDWDKLKDSLITNGYTPEKHNYIRVREEVKSDGNIKYVCLDGNHRTNVLRELYGNDYEIEVEVTQSLMSKFGITGTVGTHPDKESCPTWRKDNLKKYFKSLLSDKKVMINSIKIISVFLYLIVFNFKYFMWILLTLMGYAILTRILIAINYNEIMGNITSKIAKKIENRLVRRVINTIILNLTSMIVIIPMIIICLSMIINGVLEFVILGVIVYLCEVNEKESPTND